MSEAKFTISEDDLKRVLECMLFVSPQPLSAKHVAQSLGLEEELVEKTIYELRLDFGDRGLQIMRIAGGYQMCTKPEYSEFISLLLKPERTRLSRAGLETVAIIAYRQPITQPEIEAIRGVNSDGVLKTLTERGLIRQAGRKEGPGRPILYATCDEFLNYFGLNDIGELPELEDIELPVQYACDPDAEETESSDSEVNRDVEEDVQE